MACKPTQKDKDWALNIVTKLFDMDFEYAISYHDYGDEDYEIGLGEWRYEHKKELKDLNLLFYSGATKVCIVDRGNKNWVIKIGFIRKTVPYFVAHDSTEDYCMIEADHFQYANEWGVQEYFAATYLIGDIKGINIFIQEYAARDEDLFEKLFKEHIVNTFYTPKEIEDFSSYDWESVDSQVDLLDDSERIYAVLGKEREDLVNFAREYGINDLHNENWGITNDNRYVIFDFSGFYD